jgi:hypothetical protein
MFYFTDQYAKIWSIDTSGKFPKARIGTSEKDKEGNYDKAKNSSWFATFFSVAAKKAENLNGDEKIKILKGKVTNTSKKLDDGTWKNYLSVAIFDFEVLGGKSSRSTHDEDEEDEPLPF